MATERSPGSPPDPLVRPRVRTYAARRGRLSALSRERLERLGPGRALPPGPLLPARAFGRDAPVVLEVGCGHGAAAIAYASTYPGHGVVAVDVHTPGIARMLAAAELAGVPNLRVETGDAVTLMSERVAPGQLAAVHLFFPDPWPKTKHAKRRFVSDGTLSLLDSRLQPVGHVLLATDDAGYVAYVRARVEEHGVFRVCVVDRPPWRPVSGFERRALAAGRTVMDVRLERR